MRHMVLVLTVAAGAAVAGSGCTLSMRPVKLDARPAEWAALAGEWRGEYRMAAYDRHGTIAFKLVASAEHASGDVLMISDRFAWPYVWVQPPAGQPSRPTEPRTQFLTIRFVRADDGMISGAMDPYWDPDRLCWASATFLGSVDGNTIRGPFDSVCEDGFRTVAGHWRVERKPSSDER